MKETVDEVAYFKDGDGGKLPCILVESKADLVEDDPDERIKELEEFASNNGFSGSFFVSSKTGLNINEAMNFLLNNIIQRFEEAQQKYDEFSKEMKNISLVPDKNK